MPHAETDVENDAVDAIIAAAQQILIESTQRVTHAGRLQVSPRFQTAPQGPLFRTPSAEKPSLLSCCAFAHHAILISTVDL
jgi:hypothetical protein